MTITKQGGRIIITCDNCGLARVDQDGQRARWRPNKTVWQEAPERRLDREGTRQGLEALLSKLQVLMPRIRMLRWRSRP